MPDVPSPAPTPSERIVLSYKRLVASAEVLAAKSNEFSKVVDFLNSKLSALNLGVTAWERIRGSDGDEHDNYWSEDVGYTRIEGKWCIAIRKKSGNHNLPEDEHVEAWRFDDAPPSMRISAIDQIPNLIEKLIKAADKTARKIEEKTKEANALMVALTQANREIQAAKKVRR